VSRRIGWALLVGCIGIAAAAAAGAGAQSPARAPATDNELREGRALRRELRGGEAHRYRLALHADEFVGIVIRQHGMSVVVRIERPDGTTLVAGAPPPTDSATETIAAIADVDGSHVVVVEAASPIAGSYTIHLEGLHPRTPADETRIEAERAYARGRGIAISGRRPEFHAALGAFTAALTAFRALGDRPGEGKTLVEIGAIQWALNKREGLDTAIQAETIARGLGDDGLLGRSLYVLGVMQEQIGELAAALESYQQARAVAQSLGDRRAEVLSLNALGILYGKTADGERAISYFEQALALSRATAYEGGQSRALNNLGIAYKNVGEYQRALDAYREGLALRRKAPDPQSEAFLLYNMGNLEEQLGKDDEAIAFHRQALADARSVGHTEMEARALNAIGRVQSRAGDPQGALHTIREALAIRRHIADLPGQAASLDSEARLLHALGDDDGAVRAIEESLSIRRRLGDLLGESDGLQLCATIARDRGELAAAAAFARDAVALDETVRARLTSPQLRTTFVAAQHNKFELYIDVLERQHAADPAAGHDGEALEVSERARARVLLESMLAGSVDLRQGVDPALLDRERALQRQLQEASAQLARVQGSGSTSPAVQSAADRLDRLSVEYQQLQAEIRQRSPRYATLTQPKPLPPGEIQRDVLNADTVLLEFSLGDDRSWLWAVTPTAIWSGPLPGRATIDQAARKLYDALTARQARAHETAGGYAARVERADRDLRTDAAALSRMLLGGIASRLRGEWAGKRLAIVAAGALEYVPFAALPVPGEDNGALLGTAFEIVNLPSASVLKAIRDEDHARSNGAIDRRTVAIVADPVFDRSDPRVRRTAALTRGTDLSPGDLPSSSLRQPEALPRLPFTRHEADVIASLAPPPQSLIVSDFKASRSAVIEGSLEGYRIIHFATHGILNDARPALSGLVLSLVDERGRAQDGYARLHDIYNLRTDADLVVLSACQTALGKQIRGEGLVGLARAFMYAGAPRVVASLWEVSDAATAELMKRFYRGMLQQNLPAAAALHAAQRSMAAEPRWRAPYYWAGFILQGDWR
jgi:CHAT domain-containing protein/Flp pilus assembly protein TadD